MVESGQLALEIEGIILFFLDAGLRLGELLRLKVNDVDLYSGKVVVKPHLRGEKLRAG